MATLKQQKLVDLLPKNGWNIKKSALLAGYSPNSAKNGHILIREEGVRKIMVDYGLSEDEIIREHKKIIMQDRNLPAKNTAIDMAYKLTGAYAPTKSESKHLNIHAEMSPSEIDIRLKEIDKELKALED